MTKVRIGLEGRELLVLENVDQNICPANGKVPSQYPHDELHDGFHVSHPFLVCLVGLGQ